jgi:hypothetical protein
MPSTRADRRPRLSFEVQHLLGMKETLGRFAFGLILPDESGRILIGPALPAVMRGGEVELDRADREPSNQSIVASGG